MARPKKVVTEGKSAIQKTVKSVTHVKVANHHTGDIEFPLNRGALLAGHLTLVSGQSTLVPIENWSEFKQMDMVKHLLEKKLLEVIKSDGEVPVSNEILVDLIVPDHLKRDDEHGDGPFTAQVIKKEKVDVVLGDH